LTVRLGAGESTHERARVHTPDRKAKERQKKSKKRAIERSKHRKIAPRNYSFIFANPMFLDHMCHPQTCVKLRLRGWT